MTPKEFWNGVKPLIKKNGLTQAKLAEICNIPFGTLQGWIAKSVLPDVLSAQKIASALNTTVEYLITGKNGAVPLDLQMTLAQLSEFTFEERQPILFMLQGQIEYWKKVLNKK